MDEGEYEDDFEDDDGGTWAGGGPSAGTLRAHGTAPLTVEEEDMWGGDAAENATLRLAKHQAEERSFARAEAHEQRLLALAREHFIAPPPSSEAGGATVPEELPYHELTIRERHGERPVGGSRGGGGANAPSAMPSASGARHAALQERCRQALGPLFTPVYSYLREARGREAGHDEVNRTLLSIVGKDRLGDCMCVDELVFIEQVG